MSPRSSKDPEDPRALFEAAVAALEDGDERILQSKSARQAPGGAGRDGDERGGPRRGPSKGPPRLDRRLRAGEDVSRRVDLHGLARSAAIEKLQRFLRAGRPGELLLVIHGKGSGVLAQAVREALDRHPQVAEHVPAPPRLGGAGARIVRLRSR
ncbi:MAG TPA: Smr/MutS family protein [Thermoanaerobaculia bacterium]|nr:Smr/MutS family protein [Thermoanaerobaculia bacterium]